MKIKKEIMKYEDVLKLKTDIKIKPKKPSLLFALLIRILSIAELSKLKFKYNKIGMEKLGKKEPCLILMNHSSFIDLKIANRVLFPRRYNIISTDDSFVGKKWLLRNIGCISTRKFATDTKLVRDMINVVKKYKSSILMYPEAGYSLDGTSTILPKHLSKCLKFLKIPVVMIKTNGAFLRQPLYNNLRLRNINISADIKYLLSPSDIEEKSLDELQSILEKEFEFDYFKEQVEQNIIISDNFRAEGLNRVLYKCPICGAEHQMEGINSSLVCHACGETWKMDELGRLINQNGKDTFNHIPTWYDWQQECVKNEILNNEYHLDMDVKICVLKDFKKIYEIGDGKLTHDETGLTLTAFDGALNYHQPAKRNYSLCSDYFFYEIGDVICIGDDELRYYCFPKEKDVVTKARIATEELYKILNKKVIL